MAVRIPEIEAAPFSFPGDLAQHLDPLALYLRSLLAARVALFVGGPFMTKSESSTFPNRGTQHRIDTEVVQDLERQFRDAHKGDPDLWGQRFVDGSYLVRGSGRGRFHLLTAAGARAVGCAEEEEWIERLIQYLRDHDEDREYLKAQPTALYVNPKKTGRKPSSLPRDLSWDCSGSAGNGGSVPRLR